MLVVFETASIRTGEQSAVQRGKPLSSEDRGLLLELEYTRQRLQRVNEELQLSNEEFKSANEELQSTNEELQSTNEELETTKEELQSLNEELVTVNAQLQSKLDELADTNDDLRNLVNSTDIATVFLDNELRIKRFTPEATRVSKVIASDIGRPFTDIVSTVRYDGLMELARTVQQTLVVKEQEVQTADGRWYLLRILPYRTSSNVIDGLVLTYVDISAYKRAAKTMQEAQLYAESVVDTVREPLLILNADFRVVSANRSFYRVFSAEPDDVERHPIGRILDGRFDRSELKTKLEKILVEGGSVDDMEVEAGLRASEERWLVNARCFKSSEEQAPLILLAFERVHISSGKRT
jgi:two-component system, chemotaxis family, CheB/CheR fusion protein